MTATQEEYDGYAKEMTMAIKAVRTYIPSDILGHGQDLRLNLEAYRTLAVSIFIEAHRSKNGDEKGDYAGPSTEKQQSFISILIEEKEGSEEVTAGFLDANGKQSCMELDSSQASSLIDTLKGLKKKEKGRPNRAIKEDPKEFSRDY